MWGRKYTMLGLLAYYDLTGDKKALDGAVRLADHLLTQIPAVRQIERTGIYRGMSSCSILEPIMLLYNRTLDEKYLDFARYIVDRMESADGPQLIAKALDGVPVSERFPARRSVSGMVRLGERTESLRDDVVLRRTARTV